MSVNWKLNWNGIGETDNPVSTPPPQKKGGDQALGRSRGGFGTKVHVRVEGRGKPEAFVLTPGQRHEASVFEELMTRGR